MIEVISLCYPDADMLCIELEDALSGGWELIGNSIDTYVAAPSPGRVEIPHFRVWLRRELPELEEEPAKELVETLINIGQTVVGPGSKRTNKGQKEGTL